MQLYSAEPPITEVPLMRGENWENNLLNDVRNNLDSDKTYIIDAMMKLSEFRNIMAQSKIHLLLKLLILFILIH